MTIYAASNIAAVTISPEAHGGCGATHRRPVHEGAPAKVWALDCGGGCEDHLRHDAHWSSTVSEIPETHDEKIAREDFEKRGVLDERRLMALALARLTGLDVPDTLAAALTGKMVPLAQVAAPVALCREGHQNTAAVKFCGECGARMSEGVPPPQEDAGEAAGGNGRKARLRDMRLEDLQALAAERGVDGDGTRADLIARLRSVPVAA